MYSVQLNIHLSVCTCRIQLCVLYVCIPFAWPGKVGTLPEKGNPFLTACLFRENGPKSTPVSAHCYCLLFYIIVRKFSLSSVKSGDFFTQPNLLYFKASSKNSLLLCVNRLRLSATFRSAFQFTFYWDHLRTWTFGRS